MDEMLINMARLVVFLIFLLCVIGLSGALVVVVYHIGQFLLDLFKGKL